MQGQESVLYFQPRTATPSERLFDAAHRARQQRIAALARPDPPLAKLPEIIDEPTKTGRQLLEEWRERQRAIPLPPKPPEPQPIVAKKGRPLKVDPRPTPIPIFPPIIDIQLAVAKFYGTELNDLLSSRRTAAIVKRRQIAMFLARKLTSRSMPEIGRRFGNRDHTTVLHAINKISGLVAHDADLAAEIATIEATIPIPAAMPVE